MILIRFKSVVKIKYMVHWVSMVRNIWFLSPLVPSKQEKDIQTETTYLVCLLLQNKSFNIDGSALKNVLTETN